MASRRTLSLLPTSTRTLARAPRTQHRSPILRRTYASETSQQGGSNHTTAGIIGGLVGATVAFGGGYAWYHTSGAKTAVNLFHQGHSYLNKTSKNIQDSAPEPNEALKWLRSTAQSYAGFIPGAKYYVDQAFNDLDAVHSKHGKEVDDIVADAYNKLKALTKDKGVSLATTGDAVNILSETMSKIMSLAGDAAEDLMNNHPQLKQQLGGNIDQLKNMGEKYGPEAKKQVDETWSQIQSIISGGIGVSTIPQIKKIIQEKSQYVQKIGNELFEKGMEQAKPYLDKYPQAKQLVEENKETLKSSDMGTLVQKIKGAVENGSTSDLESFIKDNADKAGQKMGGGGISSMLSMVPNGGEIFEKLNKLSDIGQKHGKEAQDLLHSTVSEIQEVLQKKVQHAEELAKKGKDEAQNS